MQPKEVVDMWLFIKEWSNCVTGKYQADHLYRFGKFDDCGRQWRDITAAFHAKLSKDEQSAKKILSNTYYHQQYNVSTTLGVIWEAKEKPGWQ